MRSPSFQLPSSLFLPSLFHLPSGLSSVPSFVASLLASLGSATASGQILFPLEFKTLRNIHGFISRLHSGETSGKHGGTGEDRGAADSRGWRRFYFGSEETRKRNKGGKEERRGKKKYIGRRER